MKQDTNLADSVHQKTWELLPWYINNTLEASLRQLVDQHLEECKACRRELKEQQQLAQAVQQADEISTSPQQSFAKLMQRIDASEQVNTLPKSLSLLNRLRSIMKTLLQSTSPTRWVLAAQTLAIVVLLGNILLLSSPQVDNTLSYETLSNGQQSTIAHGHIRIVFSDNSLEKDKRQILTIFNARIIDGPSPSGVYTLSINQDQQIKHDDLVAMAKQLRTHESVQFAEPIFIAQP